ncbi:MAG: glycoside-pentoside-hexuronide (GPH):cation symporter [Lachnospiraceae bacterium]|uniref:Glycoside-pentoside-hexuronide (GPH):cation symporter n=1 Tax=Candidatus Enterocloster excrementigallinarum TaxID=2838558 RepID=A0A9D2PVQ4_9FIRM|nr:glycoside-pentoside-hexuronide (GPH):cation symporter [Lachnospiraceae bacterium]HJC67279.1 glycoside-pentoside-hexuronide (GPH):cation symporter [Candidatus Enterocloster excrementigallinarum]
MEAKTKGNVRPFGMADKIGYAFGDFGNDFTFMLSSMFMMKFYTDVMGVAPGIVGGLMMAARFVDAVTDVTMGQIVDRSRPTKDGKFKPWIRRMCGPLGIAGFLIFQSEFAGMSVGFKIFWMFLTYLLWGSIFYTSVNIPYGSMASAISPDPNHRAQLSTYRNIGATMASLVIGTGTPLLAYEAADGATVLSGSRMTVIAGVFAVCGIICHLLCIYLVEERVEIPQNTSRLDVGKMLRSIATNRSLLGIIAAAIMLLLGMLGMSGMAPYVFPVYYNSATAQSMSSLVSNLAVLFVCAPLAAKLAQKAGKKELSAVSCLLGAAVWLICLAIRPQSAMAFVGFYAVSYIGIGMFNTVIWAMITDVIDDAEVKNGIREDGTIYSVYSFARKLGQALSSGMIGGLMTMIGYSDAVAANPSAYPEVLDNIFNLACIIPAIGLIAVALALIFIYPLTKKRVEANVAELAGRRNK